MGRMEIYRFMIYSYLSLPIFLENTIKWWEIRATCLHHAGSGSGEKERRKMWSRHLHGKKLSSRGKSMRVVEKVRVLALWLLAIHRKSKNNASGQQPRLII